MSTWPITTLGDHLEFLTSGSRGWSQYVCDSGDLFIRIQNVGRNQLMLDDVAYVQAPEGAEANRTRVQAGDILLSITADLGRTGVVPPGLGTAYINQHLALLRVSKEFHPPFVAGYIGVGPGRHQLLRLDRVGVKSGLNFDDVRSLRLPLPPLPEQKRIAAILDKADAIRRKRQEAIRLTDELLRSAFLEMFGDPVTNPKGWEVKKLGELIRVKSGDGLSGKNMDPNGTFPVYGGNGVTGKHSQYMFEESKIVVGRVGVYCGAVHRTEPRCWVTDNALFVAEKDRTLEDDYLEWALRVADLNQYAGRAAQPLISGERVYRVEVPVPARAEQVRFSSVLKRHKHLTQVASTTSTATHDLVTALTHRAFSGAL